MASSSVLRRVVRGLTPKTTRAWIRAHQLTSDRESARRYMDIDTGTATSDLVELRIKALGGAPVFVRPGTSDLGVLRDTFLAEYHLPPPELDGDPRLIWDLGANIGTTMAHFAHAYPDARIVGVELDTANAGLARKNTEPWADRCEVIEGAVWSGRGQLEYLRATGTEWGAHVREGGGHFAQALSLNDLEGRPDYVKMDIEGAEARVLRENTAWAARVRAIMVEAHPPQYSVPRCVSDLSSLGFAARAVGHHPTGVIGMRLR